MTSLRRLLHRWHTWWCRPCVPHALGLFRIIFGAWLVFYWSTKLRHAPELLSARSVFPFEPLWDWPTVHWLLAAQSAPVTTAMVVLLIAGFACVTVGWHTRLMLITTCILYGYFWNLSLYTNGIDTFYLSSLGILTFSNAGDVFSLDTWRRHHGIWNGRFAKSILPQRLLMLHAGAIYLGAGLEKLWLPGWQGGATLWYIFSSQWGTGAAFWLLSFGWSPVLYNVAVFYVKILEISLPFLLLVRARYVRWFAAAAGTVFHVLITIFINVWQFSGIVAFYIVFLEPEEIQRRLSRSKKT